MPLDPQYAGSGGGLYPASGASAPMQPLGGNRLEAVPTAPLANSLQTLQTMFDAGTEAQKAAFQSSVSGGAAAAVTAAKTLTSADRGCLQIVTKSPVFTINAGMPAGWHVPIDGACAFLPGTGSPLMIDRRESGATYPFCVVSAATSGYVIHGSKL